MAISKRGLVDRVKAVAVQAGTRGARVLLGTAVVAARGVANLQSKLRGPPARGVTASGKPTKAPARRKPPSAKTASVKAASVAGATRQEGRKAVSGQAAAARRGTAKKARPTPKVKRGQKHRH